MAAGGSHSTDHVPANDTKQTLAAASLTALGVVYGDLGTSPLYAVKQCFKAPHGVEATPANVLGVVSLIVWSLILVVVVKDLWFVLRADNRGKYKKLNKRLLICKITKYFNLEII